MSGNLLHVNATVMCPHGGQATLLPSQSRVQVAGQPVATLSDVHTIVGCPVQHPCATIRWVTPTGRITVNGQPALSQGSVGLCLAADQAPQGTPMVTVIQQRVVGQ